jgi:hypothetical protein
MAPASPSLLSRASTTGWFDWVWGELWLLPDDGLARLSMGLSDTLTAADLQGFSFRGPTVSSGMANNYGVSAEQLKQRIGEKRSNRWIPFDAIRSARLRRGIMCDRLQVELSDGSKSKLLWLQKDPAYDVLSSLLEQQLGRRLTRR